VSIVSPSELIVPDPEDPRVTHVFPAVTGPEHHLRTQEFVQALAKWLVEEFAKEDQARA
jgi:hypothetical protein